MLICSQSCKDRDFDVQASTSENVGEILQRVIDVITGTCEGKTEARLACDTVELWFAQKKMLRSSKLSDYLGRIEKSKVCMTSQFSV